MKEREGKNIVIYGSGSIISVFANLKLIDEYLIMINPIILGSGIPLFQEVSKRHKLDMRGVKVFNNGAVLLHYKS